MQTANAGNSPLRRSVSKRAASAMAAAALVALAATGAFAQQTTIARVKVPFAFEAGKKTLPAGTYTVARTDSGLLVIASEDGTATVMVAASAERGGLAVSSSTLRFNRYGSTYFLSEVRTPGSASYVRLAPSRDETALSKQVTRDTVAVSVPRP